MIANDNNNVLSRLDGADALQRASLVPVETGSRANVVGKVIFADCFASFATGTVVGSCKKCSFQARP